MRISYVLCDLEGNKRQVALHTHADKITESTRKVLELFARLEGEEKYFLEIEPLDIEDHKW